MLGMGWGSQWKPGEHEIPVLGHGREREHVTLGGSLAGQKGGIAPAHSSGTLRV